MPQASLESQSLSTAYARGMDYYDHPDEQGQFGIGQKYQCQVVPSGPGGVFGTLGRLLGLNARHRSSPEECNPHLAALPPKILKKICAYLADPFDRATLSMTCRFLHYGMAGYQKEFALFRQVMADKQRVDSCKIAYWKRDFVYLFQAFTGYVWSSPRARDALNKTFARLDSFYPKIPERVFHEMWPMVGLMEEGDAVALLKTVVLRAKERSSSWAAMVLWEFATRTSYFKGRSIAEAQQFNDALLDLCIPLWRNPVTAKTMERVIGAIAERVNVRRFDPRTELRWKRILSLLPSSSNLRSPVVLGLASSAEWFQYYWCKYGRKPGVYFPAADLLGDQLQGFPAPADIRAFERLLKRPEETAAELEIEHRRRLRYMASPRYLKDQAREASNMRAMAWRRYDVPCETAGGC